MSYLVQQKREAGGTEQIFQQVGAAARPAGVVTNLAADLLDGIWSKVGQAAELQIRPDLFLRIQFGGIRRQPYDVPLRMLPEVLLHLLVSVGVATIPQQQQRSRKMTPQVLQKAQHLGTADVLLGIEG